ncbi:MAG: hypothetical protein HYX92_07680 [Chloroflexi bacterium]|nr:hypothetical protein [Chloroflexota bacterium]
MAAALKGEPRHGIPVFIAFDCAFFQEYCGLNARQYFSDPETMLDAQLKVRGRFYGLPHLSPSFFPGLQASALGCDVSWPKDAAGGIQVKPIVRDLEDTRRLRLPDPFRDGLMPTALSFAERFLQHVRGQDDIIVDLQDGMGPFDLACLLRGSEKAFTDIREHPRLLHRLLDTATQTCIKWVETLEARFGRAEAVISSSDYGAFLGPEQFEEFVLPYTRAFYDAFPGRMRVFHSDGDFSLRTAGCLKKLGMDVFLLFSSRLDIPLLRQALGEKVCLVGNLDPLLFVRGAADVVKNRTEALILSAVAQGPFVLSAGGWLSAGTRSENVDALIEAALLHEVTRQSSQDASQAI